MRISALFLFAILLAGGFASCNKKAGTDTSTLKMAPWRDGDKWGFSDSKGNILVPASYDNTYLLDDGYGRTSKGEKSGLVSPDGKVLAEPEYMYISLFKDGRASFRSNDTLSGYLDEQGQVAIPAQYEEAYDFEGGFAFVKKDGQYHLIQKDGTVIKTIGKWLPISGSEPHMFNSSYQPDKGFTLVQNIENESYSMGLIDAKGNTVIEPSWQSLSFPVNGIMVAQKGEKYGLIRTDGSIVAPIEHQYLYQIGADRYLIQQSEDTYSVMDQTGKIIIPAQYSNISMGPSNTFIAYQGEGVGLLDNNGKVVVPMEYNYLHHSQNYLIASKGEGKTGIISTTNQVLLPLEYDNIEVVAAGRFLADKNGKRGLIDDKGKVLLPFEFDVAAYGGDDHEYMEAMEKPFHIILLNKNGQGWLYDINGKKISEKKWLYCGFPDVFGLTYATDINGRESYIGPDGTIYAKDAPLKKVTVNNVQALFDAIGNDVEITLEDGQYDLSKANGGTAFADIYDFSEYKMEDRTIRIKEVKNLHFIAKNKGKVEWVIPYAFIPVLKIDGGNNISFSGITLGHNVEPGLCEGAVIAATNVNSLSIDNCDLYGSGTVGLELEGVSILRVNNTIIRECTYGIMSLISSNDCIFESCTFKDNTGDNMVKLQYVYGLKFNNAQFINNQTPKEYGPYEFFRFQDDNQTISLNNCTFTNSATDYFATYAEGIDEKNVNRKGLKTNKGLWLQKEPHITQWLEAEAVEESAEEE